MSESLGRFRVHHLQGNATQQGLYKGPVGEITVDTELQALRIQDGVLRGGHPTIALADAISLLSSSAGAGSSTLIHGDAQLGYYGFVPAADLITGDALASAIGLTDGISQFSNEGWFKYSYEGKTRYVAKKPLRHTVNWQQIYQAGAVYGTFDHGSNPSGTARTQDAVVTIDGVDYVVKLMSGVSADPTSLNANGFDLVESRNSEWNSVFYRLHNGTHADNNNTLTSETAKSNFEQWASYSEVDLQMDYRTGDGSASWTKETPANGNELRVHRGYWGVSSVLRAVNTALNNHGGWRPVLEVL